MCEAQKKAPLVREGLVCDPCELDLDFGGLPACLAHVRFGFGLVVAVEAASIAGVAHVSRATRFAIGLLELREALSTLRARLRLRVA